MNCVEGSAETIEHEDANEITDTIEENSLPKKQGASSRCDTTETITHTHQNEKSNKSLCQCDAAWDALLAYCTELWTPPELHELFHYVTILRQVRRYKKYIMHFAEPAKRWKSIKNRENGTRQEFQDAVWRNVSEAHAECYWKFLRTRCHGTGSIFLTLMRLRKHAHWKTGPRTWLPIIRIVTVSRIWVR